MVNVEGNAGVPSGTVLCASASEMVVQGRSSHPQVVYSDPSSLAYISVMDWLL